MAGRHPFRASFVVALALLVSATCPVAAARADPPGAYQPPVDVPVLMPFSLSDGPYGPGNRGLDYGPPPGTPVRAAAAGEVVFAGVVAGSRHVTVRHADGLRTSYSFLADISVTQGASVAPGEVLGTAGPLLHFGVREPGGRYLDPALVLAGGEVRVRLVPGAEEGRTPLAERRHLLGVVAGHLGAGLSALAGGAGGIGADGLAVLGHYLAESTPFPRFARLADALARWARQRHDCTDAATAPPAPEGRRILVLVAGIGSTSEGGAGIDDLDTEALGYDRADVIRFSYRGGRIPAEGLSPGLAGLPATRYDAADSQQDLELEARHLADLLAAVAAAEPGVPIDVVAHSQGGVVGRLGLGVGADDASLPAEVETFVTLASPHQGSDLATVAGALTDVAGLGPVAGAAMSGLGVELDPGAASVRQLREVAPAIDRVRDTPVPPGVRFVSVAARGDVVVAAPRTVVAGERAVTVDLVGVGAHSALPGSPQAAREIALARAGLPPTCTSLARVLTDHLTGETIGAAIDNLGMGVALLRPPSPAAGAPSGVPGGRLAARPPAP